MIDSVRQAGMPKSCTKMGILITFILFLTFKIFNLLYLGAFRPEVLIRRMPSRGLNSFLHLAGAFRWASIASRNLREAFRPLRFLLASCGSLSTAIDISVISNHRHTELDFYSKTAKQSEAKQNERQTICLPHSNVFWFSGIIWCITPDSVPLQQDLSLKKTKRRWDTLS